MQKTITASLFCGCGLALVLGLAACSKKADLKVTVGELEKAFAFTNSEPAQPPPSTVAVAPGAADPNAYVKAAVSAARADDIVSGVLMLEELQKRKDLQGLSVSPSQLMSIEQAKQAMIADLVARAERGDPKAKADLAAIEKTHSQ